MSTRKNEYGFSQLDSRSQNCSNAVCRSAVALSWKFLNACSSNSRFNLRTRSYFTGPRRRVVRFSLAVTLSNVSCISSAGEPGARCNVIGSIAIALIAL